MSMSCLDYKLTRRSMLAASGATLLGFQVRDLLAFAGTDHKPKCENVILFWNGGGSSYSPYGYGYGGGGSQTIYASGGGKDGIVRRRRIRSTLRSTSCAGSAISASSSACASSMR